MLDYSRDVLPYLSLGADGFPTAQLRHAFYQASIDHRDHLRRVFRKSYPDYLDINRPKEQVASKNYRKRVYRNPFRGLRTRIIETLDYIRQADDFAVAFPAGLKEDNLETYTGSGFSGDGDLTSWFFRRVRPLYVKDPNAVLIVLPTTQPVSDTVRAEPRALLIECDRVMQHKKGRFCVAVSPEKSWVQDLSTNRQSQTGVILLFVDHESYCVATQVASQKDQQTGKLTIQWTVTGLSQLADEDGVPLDGQYTFRPPLHYCPQMPAVKIGKQQQDEAETISYGRLTNASTAAQAASSQAALNPNASLTRSNDQGEEYYESLLSDALPFIERAQQIENDIAVELNFHVSSQEWRYTTKECPDSKKDGEQECRGGWKTLRNADGHLTDMVRCATCGGSGMDVSGSGTDIIGVTPPSANSLQDEGRPTNLPIPPGGFIPRSIDPLKQFAEEYKRNSDEAYATLNMQFLKATPTDQSGTSKRYDREELYRELNTQGAHLCGLLGMGYGWVGWQRYRTDEQTPTVIEPVRFNLENAELTRAELVEAKEKKFDPNLTSPLEKKLIAYQAGEDSDYYRRYELKERFDPYPNRSDEEKLFLLATGKIVNAPGSEQLQSLIERVMLSVNWDGLVNDAVRTMPNFWEMAPTDQFGRLVEANRALVGKQDAPAMGSDGKPLTALGPLVDFKNYRQVS